MEGIKSFSRLFFIMWMECCCNSAYWEIRQSFYLSFLSENTPFLAAVHLTDSVVSPHTAIKKSSRWHFIGNVTDQYMILFSSTALLFLWFLLSVWSFISDTHLGSGDLLRCKIRRYAFSGHFLSQDHTTVISATRKGVFALWLWYWLKFKSRHLWSTWIEGLFKEQRDLGQCVSSGGGHYNPLN